MSANQKMETQESEGNYKNMKDKIADTLKKARATPGDRNSLGGPNNKYWYEKTDTRTSMTNHDDRWE